MSKLAKGIGKIFKKIAKVVIKVAPFALAAAAVVFTGGAALGLGGIFAGGFAGAVGSAVSAIGLSGAAGSAIAGAITHAGFGAAIGGVLGGKKGMQLGALTGLATGGLSGLLTPGSFGVAGAAKAGLEKGVTGGLVKGVSGDLVKTGVAEAAKGAGGATGSPWWVGEAPSLPSGVDGGTLFGKVPSSVPGVTGPLTQTTAGASQGGLGGLLASNPYLLPSVLQTVGGALGGSDADEAADARIRVDQAEADRIASNYRFGGLMTQTDATVRPNPEERYRPDYYQPSAGVYRFNPVTNQVEYVQPVRAQ